MTLLIVAWAYVLANSIGGREELIISPHPNGWALGLVLALALDLVRAGAPGPREDA